ncbi:hypothetical protein ACFO1B_56435 [Dactylosporangium siamense]|uniref:Uncharacterized protein n=1 Tax=Dactylosporangium siamense TaxID=685454 RepID=A0A919PWX1_9ACTN|nr:hypothetical protein [Dactylosporangium siamense]GIG49880.1 hypothetical protein Dsi01nite_079210 [Dactylosporangium siamense]
MTAQALGRLKDALVLVQDDVFASGLSFRLAVRSVGSFRERSIYHVTLEDGRFYGGVSGREGETEEDALAEVAEGVQDLFAEVLNIAWPDCAVHNRGLHMHCPAGSSPAWWCYFGEGHLVAPVGELSALNPS